MEEKTVDLQDENRLAKYLFHQGTNYHSEEYLGVHKADKGGYVFRVWAPSAYSVFVLGDFNSWECRDELKKVTSGGIWESDVIFDCEEGMKYKFRIEGYNGVHLKADPYARMGETLKKTASIVCTESAHVWSDKAWLNRRKRISRGKHFYSAPMNIYEMHMASWRTRDGKTNKDGDAYLSYREIADLLVPYVKNMGYTHVELLPITEYPFDGSWGYQVCSYFAPTSRYGSPDDFKYFVNKLHSNGVGVILDWVPAHFPKDEHGLYEFDGSCLYEYQGWDRKEHTEWGTRCFDVGRNEVQSFLVSSALHWFKEYHIDGLRVDAVASMLYLDYARKPGEWIPNKYGGNQNLEAIAFFQKLNTAVFGNYPDVLMIAEESTSWAHVTGAVHEGGLGFNFKWNMGWANDMYEYVSLDPVYRQGDHSKLTFSMCYSFSENYILPVSHDEVVHGKKSLLDKMYGDYDEKFATDRVFMMYQMTHPGKKMTFMGCEFGQFREWDYENQLEWFMLDYEKHASLKKYVRRLNNFYLRNSPLWENDVSWEGFQWIFADRKEDNLIAFRRIDRQGRELVVVLNFSASPRKNYHIPSLGYKSMTVVMNTDRREFGGTGVLTSKSYKAEPNRFDPKDKESYIVLDIPKLTGIILAPDSKLSDDGLI